jgi:predicted nucleic acid-binding protein
VIVVDASAMLEVLLRGEAGRAVEARLFSGEPLHAPHVLDLEVTNVLRKAERRGELSAVRSAEAMDDFLGMPLVRHAHHPFLLSIWALRHNTTAYDASYLVLAEALGAPLLTRDRRLAGVPGCAAEVEIV